MSFSEGVPLNTSYRGRKTIQFVCFCLDFVCLSQNEYSEGVFLSVYKMAASER